MDKATTDLKIPTGAPNWIDLMTNDVEKGTAFYRDLFGWVVNDSPPEMEGYKYFTKDGEAVGGCMFNNPDMQAPNNWSIYLRTDDANKTCQLAKEHGGEVLLEAMKVGDNGSLAVVRDPSGAVIGAWQPDLEMGFGAMYQVGTPAHFELLTKSYDKAVEFYKNVFGWNPHTLSDETNFRYTGFGPAEAPRAGVMDASLFDQDCPSNWSVYIACENAEATAEAATRLGGKVLAAPESTPYGHLATLQDPTGAVFKIQS